MAAPARARVSMTAFRREHIALFLLLSATAFLYLWDLGASGWANGFYSAAVLAGTRNWTAFFFGSFDASNFITVDKPPGSLWVMELSARIFGVNAWSILVPQALEGVACVGVLYAAVRRVAGWQAGIIAGAALALTPVAALMFRYNNPDALLTLTLTCAAYCGVRAHENGQTKWLVLAGICIGFGFLTKMLQAFIVLPGFMGVYLVLGPGYWSRRIRQLVIQGVAVLAASGWWVAAVMLWPAGSRPYIGGSQNNSILNLIFGYNGIGRLNGHESGSVTAPRFGGSFWGPTGWDRLFLPDMGGEASWLIPAALLSIVTILWLRRKEPRSDGLRAAMLIWATWLLMTDIVFSFAQGIIHPYYLVVLGPPVGALVALGSVELWRARQSISSRTVLAIGIVVTAIWAMVLLGRVPYWLPFPPMLVLIPAIVGAGLVLANPTGRPFVRIFVPVFVLAAMLLGPAIYTVATAAQPHTGAIPPAGPPQAAFLASRGQFGFTRFGLPPHRVGRISIPGFRTITGPRGFQPPPGGSFPPGGFGGFGFRGGSLLNASLPNSQLVKALKENGSRFSWVAATIGANSAAGYQLATGDAVMALGGFNGTDPAPSLARFKSLARAAKIHYFIGGFEGGGFGGNFGVGPTDDAGRISAWVQANFTPITLAGTTLYDLSR